MRPGAFGCHVGTSLSQLSQLPAKSSFSDAALVLKVRASVPFLSLRLHSFTSLKTPHPNQLLSNFPTTSAIASSPYILNPFSFVTLANCTFFASSFSSITCFSVLSTSCSASSRVSERWYSVCNSACAPSDPEPMALAS